MEKQRSCLFLVDVSFTSVSYLQRVKTVYENLTYDYPTVIIYE